MLGGWEIIQLPVEEQVRYADYLHVLMSKDVRFVKTTIETYPDFNQWTPTTVGNYAYIALRGPEDYREIYLGRLSEFLKWKVNKL